MILNKELDNKIEKANAAVLFLQQSNIKQRAELMHKIADAIEALDDHLIQTAHKETHLPVARLQGEKGRMVFQWRNYAEALVNGTVFNFQIDTALAENSPPRPDIRKTYIGLGPVVVFGASNFPFAFSTGGGDTASAIAAGCPVIVKAHEGHPKTAEIVAEAISKAVLNSGFPSGVFSQVFCKNYEESQYLVTHPLVKAVGFTGSYKGGRALFDIASKRPTPIPVFAEMGSVNPVFVLPEIAKSVGKDIAKKYIASLTLGVGQFCTNPGLLIIPEGDNDFLMTLVEEVSLVTSGKMLHEGIASAYHRNRKLMESRNGVELLFAAEPEGEDFGSPGLARVSADEFLKNLELQEEVFGPFGLIVTYKEPADLIKIAQYIHGQLTCTIWGSDSEISLNAELLKNLTEKCGRLLFNGFPTGVEVVTSMQHGGPFPASTDSRFSSVGADSIRRFARPISYQNMPEGLLPDELKNTNPLGIYRWVNDELTSKAL